MGPDMGPDMDTGTTLRFRRIYILPTRQGIGFAVAVSIMLLGSINYDNALGYVLSFLLIGAGLVSMLHAVRNLAGLRIGWEDGAPVFAGDTARFRLRVDNRGRRPRFALLARFTQPKRRRHDDEHVRHFALDAGNLQRVELLAVAPRRGWFAPGLVTLATRFPFGLFRAWARIDTGQRCLVYPHPDGDQALPSSEPQPSGEIGTRGLGEDEFTGLREYRPGDSARRVHWKAVAREQGVPVKIFGGGAAGVTWLRWADARRPDTESRLSQLCRWVVDADACNLRYGLALPGVEIAPAHGAAHRHACLEALALFDDGART